MRISAKFLLCSWFLGIAVICQAQDQKSKVKASALPYKATYSSNFEMGDPANSRLVLEMWKDYDDNAFERHAHMIADTAVIYLADGRMVKGRDNMLADVKKYRSTIDAVKTNVHAWMSLRSIDRRENWVAIWGTEEDTWKDGKKTAVSLHEVWRFNKDGKIDLIRQFARQEPSGEQR